MSELETVFTSKRFNFLKYILFPWFDVMFRCLVMQQKQPLKPFSICVLYLHSSPHSKRPIKWLKMRLKRIPHEYAGQGMGRGLQFSTQPHFAQYVLCLIHVLTNPPTLPRSFPVVCYPCFIRILSVFYWANIAHTHAKAFLLGNFVRFCALYYPMGG